MSRIGKQPIQLPTGVKVNLRGLEIEVTGSKGTLKRELPSGVMVEVTDVNIVVVRKLRAAKRPEHCKA